MLCPSPRAVCVRYLCENGETWVYALNREPYEITVSFAVGGVTESVLLSPFALKTFRYDTESVPCDVGITLPEGIRAAYLRNAENTLTLLDAERNAGEIFCRGIDTVSARIRAAAKAENFSELRHLLQSYVVRMAYQYQNKRDENKS